MRQEIIIGTERRRRWSDEEKLSILREVGVDGASATQVARRHDIGRPQIYRGRRDLRRKGLWPGSPEAVFLTLDGPVDALQPGQYVLADKAYDADWIREMIWEQGAIAVIPSKSNRKLPKDFDAEIYKERNRIERFFGRLKRKRGLITHRLVG